MCLVIDTDCFSRVFDSGNKEHAQFVPIVNWLAGKGRMIYGGTKYNDELGKAIRTAIKTLPLLADLYKQRRMIKLPDESVDSIAAALKKKFPEAEFDDEHIVALVVVSRCCVVCTKDKTAMQYLKCPGVFADYPGTSRPNIYNGHWTHKKLCCNKNIVGVCASQA